MDATIQSKRHRLIGLVGLEGAGKTTAAREFMLRTLGYIELSFASPLKSAASAVFGWSRELLEGTTPASRKWREEVDDFWSKELGRPGFTPRQGLELLGTEAVRQRVG